MSKEAEAIKTILERNPGLTWQEAENALNYLSDHWSDEEKYWHSAKCTIDECHLGGLVVFAKLLGLNWIPEDA
jgi:hypothetical protein